MKNIWFVLLLSILLPACSSTLKLPYPEKTASPVLPYEEFMIQSGIEYHGMGEYGKAIDIYTEVLRENPGNVLALYELAFSLSMNGDHNESLRYALKGMEYDTDILNMFYTLAGNNLDILGKPRHAITVYKKGLELFPGDFMLYYNLGITYLNTGKLEDAVEMIRKAISINPYHASSHLALAEDYRSKGMQIPALLHFCKFLAIEPNTARSLNAVANVDNLVHWGVESSGEQNINIYLSALLDDESPYGALEMHMRFRRAALHTDIYKDKSAVQIRVELLNSLFALIGERQERTYSDFTAKHLFPYFANLHENEHSEAFIYYIHQSAGNNEIDEWLSENGNKVEAFLNWLVEYRWNFD